MAMLPDITIERLINHLLDGDKAREHTMRVVAEINQSYKETLQRQSDEIYSLKTRLDTADKLSQALQNIAPIHSQ